MTEFPYTAGTPATWDEGTRRFAVRDRDESPELYGPCPQCGHELTKSLGVSKGVGFGGGADKTTVVRVRCNCGHPHPGPGSDGRGCGAVGGVSIRL